MEQISYGPVSGQAESNVSINGQWNGLICGWGEKCLWKAWSISSAGIVPLPYPALLWPYLSVFIVCLSLSLKGSLFCINSFSDNTASKPAIFFSYTFKGGVFTLRCLSTRRWIMGFYSCFTFSEEWCVVPCQWQAASSHTYGIKSLHKGFKQKCGLQD